MSDDNQKNQPQRIRKTAQQARLLRQLQEQHTPLSMRIPAVSDNLYTSAILDVDTGNRRIRLDELNPSTGHQRLQVGHEIRVDTRAQGVETRFKTQVESVGEEGGISFYLVPFPEFITHHQRRAFHRVPVRMTLQSRVAITGEGRDMDVRLSDLSVGGFGGTAGADVPLCSGEQYACVLELRGEKPITADVQLRYVKRDPAYKVQRFGALFLNLDKQQRSRLERLVMMLERELVRST